MTQGSNGASSQISVPHLSASTKFSDGSCDRNCPPAETFRRVSKRFADVKSKNGLDILGELHRHDTGRLDVPVYMCTAGDDARKVLPDARLRGKGLNEDLAKASTVMELVERYSYFSFWSRLHRIDGAIRGTWTQLQKQIGTAPQIDINDILRSVNEEVSPARASIAKQLFDLMQWTFVPSLHVSDNRTVWLPIEWFRAINEFNGCSTGNTDTESILHGLCELVERHVCANIAREHLECPTINPDSITSPELKQLLAAFTDNGIHVVLKDFSMNMAVPTVGVLAWDPTTFPDSSEIVFTAGTAPSPVQAAMRALTEAAALSGDFSTNACYQPVGLPKFGNQHEAAWVERGEIVALTTLPNLAKPDMLDELLALVASLVGRNIQVYSVATTHPALAIPSHYTCAPGLDFFPRERGSLGFYVGRRLVEEAPIEDARRGLDVMGRLLPDSNFLQFFRGLLLMRTGDAKGATEQFTIASSMQVDPEHEALVSYYGAYSHVTREDWNGALPWLDRAIAVFPSGAESWSLRGICRFRLHDYSAAAENFKAALRRNKGSACDFANLGACYVELQEYDQAREHLMTALRIDPDLEPARQRLEALDGGATVAES